MTFPFMYSPTHISYFSLSFSLSFTH
jgi:hypothetical protein